MDEFLHLLRLAAGGLLIAFPILAVIAIVRTGEAGALGRKLRALESQLARLRVELRELRGDRSRSAAPREPEPEPKPEPKPGPEPVEPVEIEPVEPEPVEPEPAGIGLAGRRPAEPGPKRHVYVEPDRARPGPVEHAPSESPSGSTSVPPSVPLSGPTIDWERWVGVRGAAVLGGIVAALAGLLFVQYSIQQGWITAGMRVAFAAVFGLVCVGLGEWLRPRRFTFAPDALSGAGVVVLYGAAWAADVLYELVSMPVALGAMAAVTAGACALANHHRSQLLATFALVGGFATPLVLSMQAEGPLALFGYVLLLDLGLIFVGRQRAWPGLLAMGLVGTGILEAVWIFGSMGPDELPTALVALGLFSALFAATPGVAGQRWTRVTRMGSVLLPFLFVLHFAPRTELGEHALPIALLVGFLCAAAGWLARVPENRPMPLVTAGAAAAVFLMFATQRTLDGPLAWELAGSALLVALVLHGFEEWGARRAAQDGSPTGHGASLAAVGLGVALCVAASRSGAAPVWPWLLGLSVLAGLLQRQERLVPLSGLSLPGIAGMAGSIALSIGLCLSLTAGAGLPSSPSPTLAFALVLGTSLAFALVPLLPGSEGARRAAAWAAGAHPVPYLLFLAPGRVFEGEPLWRVLGAALLLLAVMVRAAAWVGSGALLAVAVSLGALVFRWASTYASSLPTDEVLGALGITVGAAILLAATPLVARRRFEQSPLAGYAAGLAPLLLFPTAAHLLAAADPGTWSPLLPLGLAALSGALLVATERRFPEDAQAHTAALAAHGFGAVLLTVLALTLQVETEVWAVSLALAGMGLALLWRRVDHAALKYVAVLAAALAAAHLVSHLWTEHHWLHQETRVLNELLYGILLPGAAMLVASAALRGRELERLRSWEGEFYARTLPLLAGGTGLAGLVTIFLWINVTIADWFATGEWIEIWVDRLPARDLATSISWVVYALVLLGIGMARRSSALRWVSLATLIVTLGKVFLYDLAELEGLYRVASLVGLAFSLILVSLLYQRFVFGRARPERG